MITAGEFLSSCLDRGFSFFTGTPCSYLKPIINYVIDNDGFSFVNATNEGDAVALACGAVLGGKRSVVMFQNSGLGNAANPLTSLNYPFRIPLLLIVTLRGEPFGPKDEPQHELMGKITTSLLETLRIGWSYFPAGSADAIESVLERADAFMADKSLPYALVMRKGDVESYDLKTDSAKSPLPAPIQYEGASRSLCKERPTRHESLQVIQAVSAKGTAVIATTGFTGRELYALQDRDNQLYMVGSMGCAISIGTGIALHKPELKVIVIDGDGALLMRAGALAMTSQCAPRNLIHVLLDNEVHESTGGQQTLSGHVSFPMIAKGLGFTQVFSTDGLDDFKNCLTQSMTKQGPVFIHLKTRPGVPADLGRPSVTPVQVKERFMAYLDSFQSKEVYV